MLEFRRMSRGCILTVNLASSACMQGYECMCMYGCMDVWMYVYVWMYGCMDVCVCMDIWMYGCMDVWMYGCMCVACMIHDTCESNLLPTCGELSERKRRMRDVCACMCSVACAFTCVHKSYLLPTVFK